MYIFTCLHITDTDTNLHFYIHLKLKNRNEMSLRLAATITSAKYYKNNLPFTKKGLL